MIGTFLVDTDDLGKTEELLCANFAPIRIGVRTPGSPTRARIWRTRVGTLTVDEAEFSYDMSYVMEAPDQLLLCRVRSGALEERQPGRESQLFRAGQVVAYGAQEHVPYVGAVHHALYDVITIDRQLLDDVAGRGEGGARLAGSAPRDADANQLLVDAIDHVRRGVMTNPAAAREPLIAGAVSRYLAATVVATLPTASPGQERARCDGSPVRLRRAMAFIDDNAHTDIALTEIAAAAGVTPWSLRRMFRLHQDCTPTEYVRKVRLHHAHAELKADRGGTATVTEIAHRWGFGDVRRFAVEYRAAYGHGPRVDHRVDAD